MRNLQELETSVLIDMLAKYTEKFTRLFREFAEHDPYYNECKEMILFIASELAKRQGSITVGQTPESKGHKSREPNHH